MSKNSDKENIRFVILRHYANMAEASIYVAHLNAAGIRAFLSNTNTSQLLPFAEGGIGLHVLENQVEEAREIVEGLEEEVAQPYDDDYRDADHDDIEFVRQVKERERRLDETPSRAFVNFMIAVIFIFLLMLALILGYRYF